MVEMCLGFVRVELVKPYIFLQQLAVQCRKVLFLR